MGQGAGCTGQAQRGSWYDANTACEALSWGGHDDWVLPDVHALQPITDFSATSPAIDLGVFANAPHLHPEDSESWWKECTRTRTAKSSDDTLAWATMVNSGDVLLGSGIPYHPHDKAADGWEGCYSRHRSRSLLRNRPEANTSGAPGWRARPPTALAATPGSRTSWEPRPVMDCRPAWPHRTRKHRADVPPGATTNRLRRRHPGHCAI